MNALSPFVDGSDVIRVVVETPKGSRNKYVWDPEGDCLKLKKILPAGTSFPLDFGFIPGTKAEDGDTLDAMVIMDAPCISGVIVECRAVGVMEVVQSARKGSRSKIRNDRIIAVAEVSKDCARIKDAGDIDPHLLEEIAGLFEYYNRMEGKTFEMERISGAKAALRLIRKLRTKPAS